MSPYLGKPCLFLAKQNLRALLVRSRIWIQGVNGRYIRLFLARSILLLLSVLYILHHGLIIALLLLLYLVDRVHFWQGGSILEE